MPKPPEYLTLDDVIRLPEGFVNGQFDALVGRPTAAGIATKAVLSDPHNPAVSIEARFFDRDLNPFVGRVCNFSGKGIKRTIYKDRPEMNVGKDTFVTVHNGVAPAAQPAPPPQTWGAPAAGRPQQYPPQAAPYAPPAPPPYVAPQAQLPLPVAAKPLRRGEQIGASLKLALEVMLAESGAGEGVNSIINPGTLKRLAWLASRFLEVGDWLEKGNLVPADEGSPPPAQRERPQPGPGGSAFAPAPVPPSGGSPLDENVPF